jgi:ATP-dependent DNA helicase DinG
VSAPYLDAVFAADGHLARVLDRYEPRAGQIALARSVDDAIGRGLHLLAEAPTGTGKSIGYAVPVTHHAAAGLRAVIATANIALQEQLVRKDLPLLARALPWDVSFALLKGRNNYLCVARLAESREGRLPFGPETGDAAAIAAIEAWATTTTTGDVSDLPFEPPPRLWRRYSVLAEDCPTTACRFHDECYAMRARAAAGRASVVVTNYHLLFAHLQLRDATGEELVLPHFDVAVLDEGHKAADIARDFFGFRVTGGGVRSAGRLLGRIGHEGLRAALDTQATTFFGALLAHRRAPAYRARLRAPDAVSCEELCDTLRATAHAYAGAAEAAQDGGQHAELERSARRADTLAARIGAGLSLAERGAVYYLDVDDEERAALCSKLIDVAPFLARTLFGAAKSVTVTSATLSAGESFEFVRRESGVEMARELIVGSPFSFSDQCLLVVPEGMPLPTEPAFPAAVADTVAEVIDLARGRTLGLFTSYRNLNLTRERLAGSGHRVLCQGALPRTALIDEFRRDVHSVLLGTESFWGGVDVPGESLSCVVIDRLPFLTPDDPLLDAMSERDERCFTTQSLPRAVIAFKQAFGRLIRTATDRGVVVVLDRRILTRRYGEAFLQSLPRVRRTEHLADVARFLDGDGG